MLPILLQAKDHLEQFTTANTIPGFGECQSLTSIANDMQLSLLLLLQDSAHRGI